MRRLRGWWWWDGECPWNRIYINNSNKLIHISNKEQEKKGVLVKNDLHFQVLRENNLHIEGEFIKASFFIYEGWLGIQTVNVGWLPLITRHYFKELFLWCKLSSILHTRLLKEAKCSFATVHVKIISYTISSLYNKHNRWNRFENACLQRLSEFRLLLRVKLIRENDAKPSLANINRLIVCGKKN